MLRSIPLMIFPLALYNIAMFGFIGLSGPRWLDSEITSLSMMSGAVWTMSFGDLVIVVSLALLLIEIVKASVPGPFQLADHLFSLLAFLLYLIEFLLFSQAATDVFFILMAIAFVDVVAGLAVALRTAQRDVSIGL